MKNINKFLIISLTIVCSTYKATISYTNNGTIKSTAQSNATTAQSNATTAQSTAQSNATTGQTYKATAQTNVTNATNATSTIVKPASYTDTHTDGTNKSFSITLSSKNTFTTTDTSDSGLVWTNKTGIPLNLSYQYGSKNSPGKSGSSALPTDGKITMTDQIYTITISAQ